MEDRERDYGPIFAQTSSNPSSPPTNTQIFFNPSDSDEYETYPILWPKEDFPELTALEFLSFQLIMFWDHCIDNHLFFDLPFTYTFFLSNDHKNFISFEQMRNLFVK